MLVIFIFSQQFDKFLIVYRPDENGISIHILCKAVQSFVYIYIYVCRRSIIISRICNILTKSTKWLSGRFHIFRSLLRWRIITVLISGGDSYCFTAIYYSRKIAGCIAGTITTLGCWPTRIRDLFWWRWRITGPINIISLTKINMISECHCG